jgi:hypothetical protein
VRKGVKNFFDLAVFDIPAGAILIEIQIARSGQVIRSSSGWSLTTFRSLDRIGKQEKGEI